MCQYEFGAGRIGVSSDFTPLHSTLTQEVALPWIGFRGLRTTSVHANTIAPAERWPNVVDIAQVIDDCNWVLMDIAISYQDGSVCDMITTSFQAIVFSSSGVCTLRKSTSPIHFSPFTHFMVNYL